MFSKVRNMLKEYFIPELQNDYVYYPTEDGIFAYYYREDTEEGREAEAADPNATEV